LRKLSIQLSIYDCSTRQFNSRLAGLAGRRSRPGACKPAGAHVALGRLGGYFKPMLGNDLCYSAVERLRRRQAAREIWKADGPARPNWQFEAIRKVLD